MVEFPALISLTSRPEAGIKYYSGFDMLRAGTPLLDAGLLGPVYLLKTL